MKYEDLKPGFELDAVVAEKVMGWGISGCEMNGWNNDMVVINMSKPSNTTSIWHPELKRDYSRNRTPLPSYSTSIKAVWEVVERFKHPTIWFCAEHNKWACSFEIPNHIESLGNTAPHAICLAALKAVGYEVTK